jgi:hypothetical protein
MAPRKSRNALPILVLLALLPAFPAPPPKLAIFHPVFAQYEDGPPMAKDSQFMPGESLFFSCQMEGFTRSPADKDENRKVFLTYKLEAKDSRGILLQVAATGKEDSEVSPEDKEWKPKIRETIVIPALADSGEYQVLLHVRDEVSGQVADGRATFTVKGRDVAPSDTMIVRNFRFLRSEDESKPLQVAAYRPGDSVWARFDMTGYKLGEGNKLDIGYGLSVLGPDGKVVYAEPNAADQKEQPFYPQRFQPGILNLNLAKDQPVGEYTIVLTIHDTLGKQTYETREKFSVE